MYITSNLLNLANLKKKTGKKGNKHDILRNQSTSISGPLSLNYYNIHPPKKIIIIIKRYKFYMKIENKDFVSRKNYFYF